MLSISEKPIEPLDAILKKHGYHKAGNHSAVKTCLWLNKTLRGEGSCYKSQFYGIESHRCIQMTPSLSCNHRCLHCWRAVEIPVPETLWDSPGEIVGGCLWEQQRLISGYGGAENVDKARWREAWNPKHVAISLAGEPTMYPNLPELVEEFHKRGLTTFVVTNGTNPGAILKIKPTQLYLSLNAPDFEVYLKACRPVDTGLWERINQSLVNLRLARSKTRTVIRLTLVRGINTIRPEDYAKLVARAEPDYVEIKAYMYLGFSRLRLTRNAMPEHDEVRSFGEKIGSIIGYKLADESELSRVVLLSRDGEVEKI